MLARLAGVKEPVLEPLVRYIDERVSIIADLKEAQVGVFFLDTEVPIFYPPRNLFKHKFFKKHHLSASTAAP